MLLDSKKVRRCRRLLQRPDPRSPSSHAGRKGNLRAGRHRRHRIRQLADRPRAVRSGSRPLPIRRKNSVRWQQSSFSKNQKSPGRRKQRQTPDFPGTHRKRIHRQEKSINRDEKIEKGPKGGKNNGNGCKTAILEQKTALGLRARLNQNQSRPDRRRQRP